MELYVEMCDRIAVDIVRHVEMERTGRLSESDLETIEFRALVCDPIGWAATSVRLISPFFLYEIYMSTSNEHANTIWLR